jgi:hypothetical protein
MAGVSDQTPSGTPSFQLESCPHCGANSELSTHAIYRYQCRLCGGARIPVNRNVTRTPPQVTDLLKRVRKRHIARGAWKAAANTLWLMAVLTGLLGFGLSRAFDFEVLGLTIVSLFTLVPVVVGALSKRASTRAAAESKQALAQAWSAMATHVCALLGSQYTVEDLRRAFGVDVDSALHLLAEAEVADVLNEPNHIAVAPTTTPHRVRVAEGVTAVESEEELERQQLEALRRELGHK